MAEGKYINLVFVVDASGSMFQSEQDVIGGFQRVLDEQKAENDGKCTVSLFTFESTVKEVYLGKDVNEIEKLEDYHPGGMTAMNDGIGTAIDRVGEWLNGMKEEDKPTKTMVVIMTDGCENYSTKYRLSEIQEKIKHQTEKYSWDFVYIGTDITTQKDADTLGIKTKAFSSRNNYSDWSNIVNCATTTYRKCFGTVAEANTAYVNSLCETTTELTADTEKELGIKIL